MADIFVSYSSKDRERIRVLVKTLEQQGWSVFWDRQIRPGETFEQVIENNLNAAKCVVVVWSEQSVTSDWVRNEAEEGKQRQVLVPVMIDEVKIPIAFRHVHAARLIDWQGRLPNPELELFLNTVREKIGAETSMPVETGSNPAREIRHAPGTLGTEPPLTTRSAAAASPFSFKSWIYGGLLGGLLAGMIIGLKYNAALVAGNQSQAAGRHIVLEIILYAALIGIVTGICTQYFITLFQSLKEQGFPPAFAFNEWTGGMLGGAIGGGVIGALGGWYFGLRPVDPVDTTLLIQGAAAGPPFVVIFALLYDYRWRWRAAARSRLLRIAVALTLVTIIAVALGIKAMGYFKIDEKWFAERFSETGAIPAGATLGVLIGTMLGLQIGLTLSFNRWMAEPAETE